MYGVPKCRENVFMRHKKSIAIASSVLVIATSLFRLSPELSNQRPVSTQTTSIVEEQKQIIGSKLIVNGKMIGIVTTNTNIDGLIARSVIALRKRLGYDPEIKVVNRTEPAYTGMVIKSSCQMVKLVTDSLYSGLGQIKKKAYVMRIGDDFTVSLESEEAVKEVLAKAEKYFEGDSVALEVELATNEHNSLVKNPLVLMKQESEAELLATSAGGEHTGTDFDDSLLPEKEEAVDQAATSKVLSGKTIDVQFAEEIAVVETYVNPEDIQPIDQAVELITKENEEEKVYTIENGDTPYGIALANDMSLKDLYKMNPGLEGKKNIRVGDDVVITVPEPELKIQTKVEIVYTEPIEYGTTYVDDPDSFVGTKTPVSEGKYGTNEVTAIVTRLNGDEIGREITNQKVALEPVNSVVMSGTKPLPVRGATGTLIAPVRGATISSRYGYRGRRGFHRGVDFAAKKGTPIIAADGGTVIDTGFKKGSYGYYIEVDHGSGVVTFYAHCQTIDAKVGQHVDKGEQIATVGSTGKSTGPHCHFELRLDGQLVNPLNYVEL